MRIVLILFFLSLKSEAVSICKVLKFLESDSVSSSTRAKVVKTLEQIEQLRLKSYHGDKPKLFSSPKHNKKNMAMSGGSVKGSEEPQNVLDLYKNAIPDFNSNGKTWWAKDSDGNIHRFQANHNGEIHWNGKANDGNGLSTRDVPNEVLSRFRLQAELDKLTED